MPPAVLAVADASALVSLFIPDAHTPVLKAWLASGNQSLFVTDFAAGEVSATFGRLVRTGVIGGDHGQALLSTFDRWRRTQTMPIATESVDVGEAVTLVRRFDLGLRMPDALYIATASRLSMSLLTFDMRQSNAARTMAIQVVP